MVDLFLNCPALGFWDSILLGIVARVLVGYNGSQSLKEFNDEYDKAFLDKDH